MQGLANFYLLNKPRNMLGSEYNFLEKLGEATALLVYEKLSTMYTYKEIFMRSRGARAPLDQFNASNHSMLKSDKLVLAQLTVWIGLSSNF